MRVVGRGVPVVDPEAIQLDLHGAAPAENLCPVCGRSSGVCTVAIATLPRTDNKQMSAEIIAQWLRDRLLARGGTFPCGAMRPWFRLFRNSWIKGSWGTSPAVSCLPQFRSM